MKTGGSIGLIAIGVALLSLAYTGRAQAVWAALTQDQAAAPADDDAAADVTEEPATATAGDSPRPRHPQDVPVLRVIGGQLARP